LSLCYICLKLVLSSVVAGLKGGLTWSFLPTPS